MRDRGFRFVRRAVLILAMLGAQACGQAETGEGLPADRERETITEIEYWEDRFIEAGNADGAAYAKRKMLKAKLDAAKMWLDAVQDLEQGARTDELRRSASRERAEAEEALKRARDDLALHDSSRR